MKVVNDGVLVLKEKRNVVDNFKKWYNDNVIETGLSAKLEKQYNDLSNKSIKNEKIKDKVGGLILRFIPEYKELAPLIPAMAEIKAETSTMRKNAVINGKRWLEAKLIGVDGASKGQSVDVVIPPFNIEEFLTTALKGVKVFKNFNGELNEIDVRKKL